MSRPKVQLFRGLLLLMLLLQPFSALGATAAPAPQAQTAVNHPHRVLIDSRDVTTLKAAAQSNSELLADYGSFSLWRVSATTLRTLSGKSTVTVAKGFDTIYLRSGAIDTATNTTPNLPSNLQQARTAESQLWLVQFVGPIQDEWLKQIEATGASLVMYMPTNAYVVWADGKSLATLDDLASSKKFVQWSGAYHPAYRLESSLQQLAQTSKDGMADVTVQFYTTERTEQSLQSLLGMSKTLYTGVENILSFTNVSLQVPVSALAELASRADVFNIEPWAAPVKLDERQNQIIAGNIISQTNQVVPSGPGYLSWLNGLGFPTDPAEYPVVDVVDDGVDNGTTSPLHPDFYQLGVRPGTSRISYVRNCTTDASGNGIGGHGNINVGIVGSYNNLTGSPHVDGPSSNIPGGYRIGLGVSPFTRLASTKIFRNAGPYDVSACGGTNQGVVNTSYLAGATLTSNSWGASVGGAYNASSQAYDSLTRDASTTTAGLQPMAHIFAAGNSGSAANTIGSPATAKNVISVGANENVRDHGVADGCNQTSNDNADDVVGFSSRGPTDDQRIKPDIMAPGSHIIGPASQETGYLGDSVCNQYYPAGQTLYALSSGTSHSTPAVAGVASLLHTHYRRTAGGGVGPSPAMLKAYMLNSSRYMTGLNGLGNLPSNSQGWGSVYMKQAFDSTLKMFKDQTTTFGATGEEFTQLGQVPSATQPFKVTLAWTDAPGATTGNAYVNDLNLEVTIGGQTYLGNVFSGSRSATGGLADVRNNVESVYLPAGLSGPFSVRVVAANIVGDGVPGNADTTDQDFALMIYNAVSGPTGTLAGSVKHPTGTPIQGATVSAGAASALTNASGLYQMRLPVGTYAVTATISGYSSQSVNNIVITENMTTTQDFLLTGGRLQGQIRDAFTPSQPIAGASVTVGSSTVTSDANGNYVVERLPVGTQTVDVSRVGYSPQSVSVTISDDTTTTRNITLAGGAVSGLVTDSVNGGPIAGARVDAGAPYVTTTDAAGRFNLRMPPAGYTFNFSKLGYGTVSFPGVNVTSGITTTRNAVLTPAFGFSPSSLSKTVTLGQVVTDTNLLQLVNNSSSDFTATIIEQGVGTPTPPMAPAGTGTVLIVHRNATTSASAASTALTALGYTSVITTNLAFEAKTVPQLLSYAAIVYASSTSASTTTPTDPSSDKLMAYLDAGGRLLIVDNDLGFYRKATTFYTTYLDATYGGDEPPGGSSFPQIGENIMSGVNPASADPFPDFFTTKSNSTPIMRFAVNNTISGSRITRGNYRAVYLANDIQNYGTTAAGEPIERAVIAPAMLWLLTGTGPNLIPWLNEVPTSVDIPAGATRGVTIGWDATKVSQPGTYTGTLLLNYTQVPTQTSRLPVTMIVNPSANQGQLSGTVTSAGVCDTSSSPLSGVTVNIVSSSGVTTTVTTNASGQYSYFVEQGTYMVSVAAPGHVAQSTSVTVPAGSNTVRNFNLRVNQPCQTLSGTSFSSTQPANAVMTQTLTIGNTGAAPLTWSIQERANADEPAAAVGGPVTRKPMAQKPAPASLIATAPAANVIQDGSFEASTSTGTNPNWTQGSTNFGVVMCNATLCGTGGGAGARTGSWYIWFGGQSSTAPTEVGFASQSVNIPAGAATLSFWFKLGATANRTGDVISVKIDGNQLWTVNGTATGYSTYQLITIPVSAYADGGTHTVRFDSTVLTGATTNFFVDDVALDVGPLPCSANALPWVSANPASGTTAPGGSSPVSLVFNSAGLNAGVYTGTLCYASNSTITPQVTMPVTMNVTTSANTGTLSGTVTGLQLCDAPGTALQNASVRITGTQNMTVTTDVNGNYSATLPAGTYTVQVSAPGYVTQSASVTVPAQGAIDRDFSLRANLPCQTLSATSFSNTQPANSVTTQTLTIGNTGAAPLTWSIQEQNPANQSPAAQGPATRRPVAQKPDAASLKATAPAADVIQDGGFETTAGNGSNTYWSQGSTNFGVVLCTVAACGTGGAANVAPHGGNWFVWFGGQDTAAPTEQGFISQNVVIPTGTASLKFWFRTATSSGRAGDFVRVTIDGTQVWSVTATTPGYATYQQVTVPINAFANGASHTVRFESTVLTGAVSNFLVDDVMLDSTATPTCSANALPWVSANPASGTVAPGGNTPVAIVFNSAGLAPGTYTGKLCYTSNSPTAGQVTMPVTLTVTPGIAPITGLIVTSNSPVTLGSPSMFSASVQSGDNVVYTWNFGDGTINNGPANRTHTYAAAGTYTVTVTATNGVSSATQQITMVVVSRKIYLPLIVRN